MTTKNLLLLTAAATLALAGGCAISTRQEVAMGQDYARQINAELPIVTDPEVNRYITVLGDSIASVADERNLNWEFRVVNSREVNAFAVPGGFIYLNRGLIERADNLSQVAGVIAHEIAHVTERHTVEAMQRTQGATLGVGLLCILTPQVCQSQAGAAGIQIGAGAVFASFSRAQETESDIVAVGLLIAAHIDPHGVPDMFRKLLEERSRRADAVNAFFATHPLEEDRIAATEAEIARYDASSVRGLTKDSPRFQDFKSRLASLPYGTGRGGRH